VYIFSSGTDITNYDAISSAYSNGSYQAVGVSPASGGVFTLYTWSGGSQGGSFSGNGNFPTLLLNSSGSITEPGNPLYAQATISFANGAGTISHSSFTAVVYDGGSGGEGALTINGLPAGGTRAVYVFNSGTDISTYDAITTAYLNGSYQALGASPGSDGAFTLYTWTSGSQGGGFTGNGSFPVLLLNSGGSITDTGNPMYAQATVSFSNGTGAVSYGSFTAVVYDCGTSGEGALTINGLPAGGTRAVYVFNSGTDISTYDAITTAYLNGSYQALGASPGSDGAFTLYTWTSGSQGGGFSGNGNFPVLLLNSGGSITDTGNPMYAQATVSFSNGTGAVSYSSFTAVVYGDGNTAVTAFSLTGKVTAPVRGETPVTTAINEAQYTGSIAWQTSGGVSHTGAFAASTVYRAVVTLTAKAGWTFNGVEVDSFSYTGATSVANAANSGTVTITFPATAVAEVSALILDSLVTAPVRNVWPDTDWINETQYTGTIEWQTENGETYGYYFADATIYRAVLTLTAKANYTFDGVAENSFTYTGATSIANAANSGTVTITFPATESAVSAFSLDGKVTAPVNRATPITTPVDTDQYTGSVAWKNEDGTALAGNFEPFTVYQAVVVLTAKAGWTFDGVWMSYFTYSGATVVPHDTDRGTVTITFPATLGDPNTEIPSPIGNPSVKLYLNGGATALAHGGTTPITVGTGTYVVSIDSDHSSILWYLNGTQLTQYAGRTSITLSKRTAGTYLVTVEATPQGGERQSGAHTFTVE
jgi:hypothetical protein